MASTCLQTPCANHVFPAGTLDVDIVGRVALLTVPLNMVPPPPSLVGALVKPVFVALDPNIPVIVFPIYPLDSSS
jgi:hypothetical protein